MTTAKLDTANHIKLEIDKLKSIKRQIPFSLPDLSYLSETAQKQVKQIIINDLDIEIASLEKTFESL